MSASTDLPDVALLVLARAGLRVDVYETEAKFARIQATYDEETQP